MGVDIDTYRSRVGLFVSSRGAGIMMMPFVVDFSHILKLIGAVSFVGTLLIKAGIEQNPGPTDQFIYRYQYLLIEIGTKVLRKVFDNLVNNDFMRYLNAKPNQNTRLQFLMLKGIITDAQKTFLPPLDKKPTSSNFDITLLVCLLRNVCGLRGHTDTVWKNPSPTDFALEADIARLRKCRNDLAHIGTVYISEADLTTKWNELSTILKSLNRAGRITNLSSSIDDAEHLDIDKELKEKFDIVIKSWVEMDRLFNEGIVELKLGQSTLKDGQSGLKTGQSELKAGQSELKDGQSGLKTGQSELKAGQSELKGRQSGLKTGQSELKAGQSGLKTGQSELKDGQSRLKTGQSVLKAGQSGLKAGLSELKGGQWGLKTGQSELKAGQSEMKACQSTLKAGQSELKTCHSELKDGQSGLKTGQSELKAGHSELKEGQSGLKTGQSELKAGQSAMKNGQSRLKAGQSVLKAGQSGLKAGQSELKDGQWGLKTGQSELKAGHSELKDGQSGLKTGQSELKAGQSELKDGQSRLKTGQSVLKAGQSGLKAGLSELKGGQWGLKTGQSELKAGQSEMKAGQSTLKAGQSELKTCHSILKDGQSGLKTGQSELKAGHSELKEGQSGLKTGQSELKAGQSELKNGQSRLKTGQSVLKAGQSGLKAGQSELKDGQWGLKTGQSELKAGQSGLKAEQFELKDGQSGLKTGQSELKAGHSELKDGQSGLKTGQSELKAGQSELKGGQSGLKTGQSELKAGHSELKEGQSGLKTSQSELKAGQSELKGGQSGLKTGQSELKAGQFELKDGQSGLKTGQSELKTGQSELKDGQSRLKTGLSVLKAGLSGFKAGQFELKDGQSGLKTGQSELKDGQSEMKAGQSELKAGQSELKTWHSELKDGQSGLKTGQSVLKSGLTGLKAGQSELKADVKEGNRSILNRIENLEQNLPKCKHSKSNVETDFKGHLMKVYRKYCSTLPASPLCCEDDKVDLLTFYQPPTMSYEPYHREQSSVEKCSISSYEKIFCKEDCSYRNIYITGDAGVGKTSFCQCMSLLWCKSQSGEHVSNSSMQKDIDFMAKFELVFYVSLRESDREDILDMIIDQLFYTKSKDNREEMYKSIEKVLKERECLIILDGLDEWSPKPSARKVCVLPKNVPSERCIHLTTCRPYIIENNRLSGNDLDHHVQITGIHGLSSERYISAIVNHVNNISKENKNPADFVQECELCGLNELLSIPMITSQLIVVWFDKKLTGMSRALIYSTIVEMLFERAEMRKIPFPSPTDSVVPLPVSLSEFIYIKKHFSFLREICLLSFRSLFKQDECSSILVYTKELLMKEPYSFSAEKIDFLCKIGILSKNKVIGRFGKKEHKLSFLHKSYVEFFAALFVSSFDTSNLFDIVVKKWSNVESVMQFHNFSLLLAGFSAQKVQFLFENICPSISNDLIWDRKKAILRDDWFQIWEFNPLQNMAIACFREIRRSIGQDIVLKLEKIIFDGFCDVASLKQLLSLNAACVKSIYVNGCKYLDEFGLINSLQCLHMFDVLPNDFVKFTQCMSQNESTLHTVSIGGRYTLIPEFALRRLQHLTSFSLYSVIMHYDSLCNLTKFLSDNVRIENIKLDSVHCDSHPKGARDCASTLNLSNHTKLTSLFLNNSAILCKNVNTSSLKSVEFNLSEFNWFHPKLKRIFRDHIELLNCIEGSQLEELIITGSPWDKTFDFDYNILKTLTSTVKSLQYIKSLTLRWMKLPHDVLLQLHPEVSQVEIKLNHVTMSCQCFDCFIESVVYNESVMEVELCGCMISSVGETCSEMSRQVSMDYMYEYLRKIPTVYVILRRGNYLNGSPSPNFLSFGTNFKCFFEYLINESKWTNKSRTCTFVTRTK